ncbi:uncharacterized protein LOC114305966 isoform X1 [Camellia sinensis]|nr:uncharacterized protein LOC114305966 isoform X1 [Camellia sinensis]XP_028106921.1 uncharacterized protein LOC114305966 isoform X1 [Camellia sinensis]
MAVVESGKKVMVAIDESGSSYHALMWVLENLRESISRSANPLIIFMAQPSATTANVFAAPLGSARMYCPILANSEFVNSVQEQNKVVSMGILEKAKSICASHGVNAETIAQDGDPKQAICDAVEKYNINLLVLGDHELGKVKRALIGSVSSYCVHNAKCPVLVVKKPE